MIISYYIRNKTKIDFSIEKIFYGLIKHLPPEVKYRFVVSPFQSRGILRRIFNIFVALINQSDVNHVTGDVHYLTIFLKKSKTLLTIHDCVALNRLKGIKRWLVWFFWYWLPIHRSAKISVISNFTKKELLGWVKCDPTKIEVIYNPLPNNFHFRPKIFNKKKPVILQVGARPNKNLQQLTPALKGLSVHLRVIGSVSTVQVQNLNKYGIEFSSVNNISDKEIIEEYKKCDLVIFVSTYEGFGMPIIEAQATGRPVITSNICSMPEISGNGACLVDPYNISDIRKGILKVVNDSHYRNDLVRKGLANTRRFQIKNIVSQYFNLYKQILSSE